MFIERAAFHQVNPTGDPYVVGEIAVRGEFTPQEWSLLREAFIALGLLQNLRKGVRYSEVIPSRREILDAFRDNKLGELARKYPGFNWRGGATSTCYSKCDGDHGEPKCKDPHCWLGEPPPRPKAWPQLLLEDQKQ